MKKKLYSISELINENIELKKRLSKRNKEELQEMISLINLMQNARFEELETLKRGFEIELKKY